MQVIFTPCTEEQAQDVVALFLALGYTENPFPDSLTWDKGETGIGSFSDGTFSTLWDGNWAKILTIDELRKRVSDRGVIASDVSKDIALFVGFYFWSGFNKRTLFSEFDEIYSMAKEFVDTHPPCKTWEDSSFEEAMYEFIKSKQS